MGGNGARTVKIAFYLDPVRRETGALRVIPGSHRLELDRWEGRSASDAPNLWGIAEEQVPSVALESDPGDMVVFDQRLMHAAFGGGRRRRMFTLNLHAECKTPTALADVKHQIVSNARMGMDQLHSDAMRATASTARRRRLEQVIALEADTRPDVDLAVGQASQYSWVHVLTH
jgi:ectoine hydroxylase-related dioxygenase (phytanoyl-CoA dioxygenase family)